MSIVERVISKLQNDGKTDSRHGSAVQRLGIPAAASGPANALGRPIPHPDRRIIKLDRTALRMAGLLPPEADETRLAIEYRHVKRPLIRTARELLSKNPEQAPFIMIASAIPGEGKTFTAVNLALSLSLEKDLSVLLVDGDVAKGHISSLFGLEHEHGLLDALSNPNADVESMVVSTDASGLSILPSGTKQPGATELLASVRMKQVLHALAAAEPSRLVVLDSPPILLTTESRALASLVGQIVVVVKSGSTPRHTVDQALDALEDHENVSLILNQCTSKSGHGYYEYGVYTSN